MAHTPAIVAGAALAIIAAPIAAPALLGLIGFGVAGPVAGSIAAGIQAGIGNVVAGSLFATCQGIGMGAALPTAGYVVAAAVGGVVGGAVAAGDEPARLEDVRRRRQPILVYVWLVDGERPNVSELEDTFTWPHFTLDSHTLQDVGFDISTPASFRFKWYNTALSAWSTVRCDHVLTVTENERIFLKAFNVTQTPDFDDLR